MAIQNTGQIKITDVSGEFGGSAPHALSEYYGAATGVPNSGQIALSDFYGTSDSFSVEYVIVAGGGGGGPFRAVNSCLLYTSPSPRD